MGFGSDWRRPACTRSRMATLRASRCSGHHLPRRVGVESKNYMAVSSRLVLGSIRWRRPEPRTILRANCAFGSQEPWPHGPGPQSNWTRATPPSIPCPRAFTSRILASAWGKRRSRGRRKSCQAHRGSPCSGSEDKKGGSSMRGSETGRDSRAP